MPAVNSPVPNTEMLRDIHLPDAISWWPPAIGWWLVLAIIILSIVFIPKLYHYFTFTPLKKVAKQSFEEITSLYNNNNDVKQLITDTSKLLRQVAMSYYSRQEVAQLTGDKWIEVLNKISEKVVFSEEMQQSLINAPYQKQAEINPQQLIKSVNDWLLALPKKTREQQHA